MPKTKVEVQIEDARIFGIDKAVNIKEFQQAATEKLLSQVKIAAEILRQTIRTGIRTSGSSIGAPFDGLEDSTIEDKESEGAVAPSKPLIRHEEYIDSFVAQVADEFKFQETIAYIGIDKKDVHGKSKQSGETQIPTWKLATIHEKGAPDVGLPARPHLQPSWDVGRKKIEKIWKIGIRSTALRYAELMEKKRRRRP